MKTDAPLKPLAIVALALLLERPMHPYEMYQLMLQRGQDATVKVRPGTLYHTVGWLQAAGFVTATGTDREGNRPERTTYSITAAGSGALEATVASLIGNPELEYSNFVVAMGEAHTVGPEALVTLLRSRLEWLEDWKRVGTAREKYAADHGVPRRYLLAGEFALRRLDSDVAWIESLIHDIESGALTWDEQLHKN